jgi:hypothetical protein
MVTNIQSYWNLALDFYFFRISLKDITIDLKNKNNQNWRIKKRKKKLYPPNTALNLPYHKEHLMSQISLLKWTLRDPKSIHS